MKSSKMRKLLWLSSMVFWLACSPKNNTIKQNMPIIAGQEGRDTITTKHNSSPNHEKNQAEIDSIKRAAAKKKGG